MAAIKKRSVSSVVKVTLDVAWYGVALAGGLAVVMLLLASSADPGTTLQLGVPVAFEVDLETHGMAGSWIREATGTLSVPLRRNIFVIQNIIGFGIMLALLLWVLNQLRAIFRTVRDGQPFVAANVRRIRWVGVAMIAAELIWPVVIVFENSYAKSQFVLEGLAFTSIPPIDIGGIVHGLIVLAIAEAFKVGARLDEDQSLTV